MELVIVLIVALIVLGPKRLPDAGRSLGAGFRNFKSSLTGEDRAELDFEPATAAAAPAPPAPARD